MNTRIMRLMRLHRLCAPAGEGGSDTGGTDAGLPPATTTEAPATTTAPAADASTATLLGADDEPAAETPPADGGEAKPEGEGEKKPEDEKKPTDGAPEEYADFAMPEGVQLDAEMASDFKAVAKELNLTQEQAQRVADLGVKQAQKAAGANAETIKRARADWSAAAAADKEFGGEEFNANLAYARKARDTFGTPEFKDLMNGSGLGDHPEVLRFMVRAGKAISADTFVSGGASKAQKSDADVFYGGSTTSQPAR